MKNQSKVMDTNAIKPACEECGHEQKWHSGNIAYSNGCCFGNCDCRQYQLSRLCEDCGHPPETHWRIKAIGCTFPLCDCKAYRPTATEGAIQLPVVDVPAPTFPYGNLVENAKLIPTDNKDFKILVDFGAQAQIGWASELKALALNANTSPATELVDKMEVLVNKSISGMSIAFASDAIGQERWEEWNKALTEYGAALANVKAQVEDKNHE